MANPIVEAFIKEPLTQAELHRQLCYDPVTGKLTNRIQRSKSAPGEEPGYVRKTERGKSYRHVSVSGRNYRAHRLIWLYVTGAWPEYDVDHEDGNGTNNAWSNLRSVTRAVNSKNLRKRRNNTSGHNGVYWSKDENKWHAQITDGFKKKSLGLFADIADAVAARKAAEIAMNFHPNHGAERPL